MKRKTVSILVAVVVAVLAVSTLVSMSSFASSFSSRSSDQQPSLNCSAIGQTLGTVLTVPSGSTTGICDLVFVRQSPQVIEPNGVVDNQFTLMNTIIEFEIVPGSTTNQTVWVMGDFSLLESELNPVLDILASNQFTIISIHNHMLGEQPVLLFMHWMVEGNLQNIEGVLQQALAQTSIGETTSVTPQTTLNCAKIAASFGPTAIAVNGPVCDVIIHRENPANFHSAMFPNIRLNDFSLQSSVFEFKAMDSSGHKVMVMADFGLLWTEVNSVLKVLNDHGWTLTGVHPHMLETVPTEMSWSHYEVVGNLNAEIAALKLALSQTTILGDSTSTSS